jgi:riboflavin synthase
MFTGLIEDVATVTVAEQDGTGGLFLGLRVRWPAVEGQQRPTALGDSIAVNGCCLTAIAVDLLPDQCEGLRFALSPETLARTALGAATAGTPVNVERALRLGDRLGGHLVSGHVDGLGQLASVTEHGAYWELVYNLDRQLEPEVVVKGSIAIDGVSLTVNATPPGQLAVTIIPHTAEHTQLLHGGVGKWVHLETDLLAKHVRRLWQFAPASATESPGLSLDKLRQAGFA